MSTTCTDQDASTIEGERGRAEHGGKEERTTGKHHHDCHVINDDVQDGNNGVAQPSLLQFALLFLAHQIDNDPDVRIDYEAQLMIGCLVEELYV